MFRRAAVRGVALASTQACCAQTAALSRQLSQAGASTSGRGAPVLEGLWQGRVPQQGWRGFAAGTPAPAPPGKSLGTQLADARKAVRHWMAAPARAGRAAKQRALRVGEQAYDKLPARAQGWIDAASKPGSVQRVLRLQFEAFWTAHGNKVILAGGLTVVYFLWRGMFRVTGFFVNLSESMAEWGFLALAAAISLGTFFWVQRRWTINPDAVYRNVMYRLNTNPGILEVMGAPVTGSGVRAMVTTGGGLKLRGLLPSRHSRRLQMIFPLAGPARRGLVSLEAKKRRGRYIYKLLAVDVPAAPGAEQRVYLEGDEAVYNRGSVIGELRDPFLNAMAMQEAYDREDELDDDAAEALEAQQSRQALALTTGPQRAQRSFWWDRLLASSYAVTHWVSSFLPQREEPPKSMSLKWERGKVARAA